jgi:nucleotide-binding universal stress UspA family protein
MDKPVDFDDILVPTDGSKSSRRAAAQAIKFARRNDATLHVLYAMDMGDAGYVAVPSDIEETRKRLEQKGREYVSDIEALAAESDVRVMTKVTSDTPIEAIHKYVDENDIDLVVMGKRGRSDPDKPLVGSITNRVIGSLDVPVFTA